MLFTVKHVRTTQMTDQLIAMYTLPRSIIIGGGEFNYYSIDTDHDFRLSPLLQELLIPFMFIILNTFMYILLYLQNNNIM